MVFPIDVHKRIKDKGKLSSGENRSQLIGIGFFVLNVFGGMLVSWFLSTFFQVFSLGWTLLILLVLNLTVGVFVFRFLIFDENQKIIEFRESNSDSFDRFVYVRGDVVTTLKIAGKEITLQEFSDGSAACVLELKFGSNDDYRSKRTREVLHSMETLAGTFGMEFRLCVMPEDITKSDEYNNHINFVNSVQDAELRNCLVSMTQAIIEQSKVRCNTNCLRITVRSTSMFGRSDLEAIVKNYLAILKTEGTAIRAAKFLNNDELRSFFCEFYGMSAIDTTMMRSLEISRDLDNDYSNFVMVYKIKSTDGHEFKANKIDSKIFNLEERRIG